MERLNDPRGQRLALEDGALGLDILSLLPRRGFIDEILIWKDVGRTDLNLQSGCRGEQWGLTQRPQVGGGGGHHKAKHDEPFALDDDLPVVEQVNLVLRRRRNDQLVRGCRQDSGVPGIGFTRRQNG